jgi:hypothetical protein
MKSISKTQIAEYQQLIVGLPKVAPNLVLTFDNQSYTTAQLVVMLQTLVAAATSASDAKAAWHAAALAESNVATQTSSLAAHLRPMLQMMFAASEPSLTALGLTARKTPAPLTSEQQVARAAKARATRVARGTTSKKQKAAIHGNVSGVTITPVVTGATAGSTTSGATSSGNGVSTSTAAAAASGSAAHS